MTWIKKMYMFEEEGKYKLVAQGSFFTLVFPSIDVRQWWIDNFYKKIGVAEFIEGKPITEALGGKVNDS